MLRVVMPWCGSIFRRIVKVFYKVFYFLFAPLLQWHMRKMIVKNKKRGLGRLRPGVTVYSHISRNDRAFIFHEKMMDCRFTTDPSHAEVMLLWGTKFFVSRYLVLLRGTMHQLPLIIAEDGFVRSMDIEAKGSAGLSVIVDSYGVFYDAGLGCCFDNDLNSNERLSSKQVEQARRAMGEMRDKHISKYNLRPAAVISFNPDGQYRSVVLVIDQRKGDQSITGAKANHSSFRRMLRDAIHENADSLILIKTHPDAISGEFKGYYSSYKTKLSHVKILDEDMNPISLLKAVDKLYVVSSQMGMEGLMCGKEVYCYGAPFYSGWGLTKDRGYLRRRLRQRKLEDLFYIAYIKYAFYYRPDLRQATDLCGLIDYLAMQMKKESQEGVIYE